MEEKATPEQYAVLRGKGTEASGTGKYLHSNEEGTFKCLACGNPLFASGAEFEGGISSLSGWPSFEEALPGAVKFEHDEAHGMNRTEVLCARCGSHLGHIFDDSTAKTGKHFCVNSVC